MKTFDAIEGSVQLRLALVAALVLACGGCIETLTPGFIAPPKTSGLIRSFRAEASCIRRGQAVSLFWDVQGASVVQLQPGPGATQQMQGSARMFLQQSTRFVLEATAPQSLSRPESRALTVHVVDTSAHALSMVALYQLPTTDPTHQITDIAAFAQPSGSTQLSGYLIATNRGLFLQQQGQHTELFPVTGSMAYTSVYADEQTPGRLFAAAKGRIYISLDYGVTWNQRGPIRVEDLRGNEYNIHHISRFRGNLVIAASLGDIPTHSHPGVGAHNHGPSTPDAPSTGDVHARIQQSHVVALGEQRLFVFPLSSNSGFARPIPSFGDDRKASYLLRLSDALFVAASSEALFATGDLQSWKPLVLPKGAEIAGLQVASRGLLVSTTQGFHWWDPQLQQRHDLSQGLPSAGVLGALTTPGGALTASNHGLYFNPHPLAKAGPWSRIPDRFSALQTELYHALGFESVAGEDSFWTTKGLYQIYYRSQASCGSPAGPGAEPTEPQDAGERPPEPSLPRELQSIEQKPQEWVLAELLQTPRVPGFLPKKPAILRFEVVPSQVKAGAPARLYWETRDAELVGLAAVPASGALHTHFHVYPTKGELLVRPTRTTRFAIRATASWLYADGSATLTVTP